MLSIAGFIAIDEAEIGRVRPRAVRVTLVVAILGPGGAERVMATMANYWAQHDCEVTVITIASTEQDFYPLHRRVHRIGLGLYRSSSHFAASAWNNLVRLKRLRQEIRASRPDIVLSFIDTTNVLTLVAGLGLDLPIIACEHTDPRYHKIGPIWAGLRYLIYRRAVAVVVLTNALRGWAQRLVSAEAVRVIPNPVAVSAEKCQDNHDHGHREGTIAAMGRLGPEKGFDILLRAFAQVARKRCEWSLIILGEGRERRALETLIEELGIKDRVTMPGRVQDPFQILRGLDMFVLSSRYEGFPMALVEAMACGLAVISTDFPSGVRDIVRDGTDAVVVPPDDVDALAAAMDRLMASPAERNRLRTHAVEVGERFGIEKVMSMWDELIKSYVPAIGARMPRTSPAPMTGGAGGEMGE